MNKEIVPLVIITHASIEKNVRNAIEEIDKLDIVKAKTAVIRIEEMP